MAGNHYSQRAREIVEKIIYITIASADKDGQPWNTPVYAAYDENNNFYWISDPQSQHSRNITENPNVFLVIYDSTVREGDGEGVYIKARASEVTNPEEIKNGLRYYYLRRGKVTPPPAEDFMGENRCLYKAVPKKVWINTDEKINGYHVDGRIEIKL